MKSYVIADRSIGDDASILERVRRLGALPVDMVQLRDKTAGTPGELLPIAQELRRAISTTFIINTFVEVAQESNADGVHLPASAPSLRRDDLLIGRSCHSLDDCRRAVDEGADYVLFGPVFAARSKSLAPAVTLRDLSAAAALHIDVFALGGITVDTLPRLAECGIAGVAAITLFMSDEPIDEIVEQIRTL